MNPPGVTLPSEQFDSLKAWLTDEVKHIEQVARKNGMGAIRELGDEIAGLAACYLGFPIPITDMRVAWIQVRGGSP